MSWRPILRMARRDALRHRGRSVLVLFMIALPVLAVTAADVVYTTSDVSGVEGIERRIGAADASVSFLGGEVQQGADPHDSVSWGGSEDAEDAAGFGPASISRILGRTVEGAERREGSVRARTDKGVSEFPALELDLRSPMAEGLFTVVAGRAPASTDEVVVSRKLAARGPGVGEQLEIVDGSTLDVVGIVESSTDQDPTTAVALVGGFGIDGGREDFYGSGSDWLIDAAGPVTWEDVLTLNAAGAVVVSAEVLRNPPPESELAPEVRGMSGSTDDAVLAVAALIVVMTLIEVVLLAGPAFAVGARRQSRNLALLAASGGTPRQMRRVILASGLVLGSAASALGVGLGLVVAWAALPVVQSFSGQRLGPYDVPWLHLLGIAGFGLLSALLAAVVPAWIASRQDVVAVLAGRRGDPRPSLRFPLLGLVLLAVGVAASVMGARQQSMGEFWIAFAAIPAVLGMVLLVPVVLALVARLARVLPLSLRYAVRDAARHRTRTVPAVAAVAATVAGVVALGISVTSDETQNRETYRPMLAKGDGVLNYGTWEREWDPEVWTGIQAAVAEHLPGNEATSVSGLAEDHGGDGGYLGVVIGSREEHLLDGWSSPYGSSVLVGEQMPGVDLGVPGDLADDADRILASGGAVVFTSGPHEASTAQLRTESWTDDATEPTLSPVVEVPAVFVPVDGDMAHAQAVVAPEVATQLGIPVVENAIVVEGPVDPAASKDLDEAVRAVTVDASWYVERGYERDDSYVIVLLVLGALGAVLMLGGTLTATFLALSDARPDLATLSAVGAAPRARRAVAASYALVVGLVGALLGAAVGFIPGVAVTYPLTRSYDGITDTHFLDVPWLMITAVVLVLPLLTAVVVGLFARSRLPMVARVD